MNRLLLVYSFLTIGCINGLGQNNCDEEIQFLHEDLNTYQFVESSFELEVLRVDGSSFYQLSENATHIRELINESKIDNKDSLESSILTHYPNYFIKDSSCIFILSDTVMINGGDVEYNSMCNKEYADTLRGGTTYKLHGIDRNHLIVYNTAYETWGYTNINLENGQAFGTLGYPIFLKSNFIFNIDNYYDGLEMRFFDTANNILSAGVVSGGLRSVLVENFAIYIEYRPFACQSDCHYLVLQVSMSE